MYKRLWTWIWINFKILLFLQWRIQVFFYRYNNEYIYCFRKAYRVHETAVNIRLMEDLQNLLIVFLVSKSFSLKWCLLTINSGWKSQNNSCLWSWSNHSYNLYIFASKTWIPLFDTNHERQCLQLWTTSKNTFWVPVLRVLVCICVLKLTPTNLLLSMAKGWSKNMRLPQEWCLWGRR